MKREELSLDIERISRKTYYQIDDGVSLSIGKVSFKNHYFQK